MSAYITDLCVLISLGLLWYLVFSYKVLDHSKYLTSKFGFNRWIRKPSVLFPVGLSFLVLLIIFVTFLLKQKLGNEISTATRKLLTASKEQNDKTRRLVLKLHQRTMSELKALHKKLLEGFKSLEHYAAVQAKATQLMCEGGLSNLYQNQQQLLNQIYNKAQTFVSEHNSQDSYYQTTWETSPRLKNRELSQFQLIIHQLVSDSLLAPITALFVANHQSFLEQVDTIVRYLQKLNETDPSITKDLLQQQFGITDENLSSTALTEELTRSLKAQDPYSAFVDLNSSICNVQLHNKLCQICKELNTDYFFFCNGKLVKCHLEFQLTKLGEDVPPEQDFAHKDLLQLKVPNNSTDIPIRIIQPPKAL